MTDNRPVGTIPDMGKDPTKRAIKRPWTDVLAKRLHLARGKMTQEALGARIGVKKPSISSWESGETAPSLDNLYQISAVTGLSLDWLMGRGPDELPELIQASETLSRARIALASSAVLQVLLEARRMVAPEDLSAMILATHDWAASNEKQRGALPTFEEVATFVRHAVKMH